MLDLDDVTANPLSWPTNWHRTEVRKRARFDGHSMQRAIEYAREELGRMGVIERSVIISSNVELRRDGLPRSNQRIPSDPGVAVYFKLDGEPHVLACDRWTFPEHNLWAIAKHIEALRAQDRWGVGTIKQAFSGYKALPPPSPPAIPWRRVLGFNDGVVLSREQVRAAYEVLAKQNHPDQPTGDRARFEQVVEAWTAAKREYPV